MIISTRPDVRSARRGGIGLADEQKPRRPGLAPALGLRAAGDSQVPDKADLGGPNHKNLSESSDSQHRHAGPFYVDANGNQHGFVWCNGDYAKIDVPGGSNTGVFSINANGEIVGSYDDASGVTHGYFGKPAH
jgi:hypothetical protein